MYTILNKERLVPNTYRLTVSAPAVARKVEPGQFVIVTIDEQGERTPLTVADWDREAGTIDIVVTEVGATSRRLTELNTGDAIVSLAGPLGNPSRIQKFGTVVCAGGCIGIAAIRPIARALKEAGNTVVCLIEARSQALLYWQQELLEACDELVVSISDYSPHARGWNLDRFTELMASGRTVDRCVVIGCTYMMKTFSEATKPLGIRTVVRLNSLMLDGTGMCGCCRVQVDGESKFACVHGPEFDGHLVDWDMAMIREKTYEEEEIQSLYELDCKNWVDFIPTRRSGR